MRMGSSARAANGEPDLSLEGLDYDIDKLNATSYGVQLPPLQWKPGAQSGSVRQEIMQDSDPHAYGAHDIGASLHAPVPSQKLQRRSTPATHEFAPQVVLVPG